MRQSLGTLFHAFILVTEEGAQLRPASAHRTEHRYSRRVGCCSQKSLWGRRIPSELSRLDLVERCSGWSTSLSQRDAVSCVTWR